MRPPASATRFGDKTEEGAQGKIVIAIAHRLSTIAAMDRLIVLEEGDIAETGTHRELLKRGRIYAALWRRQSGGFGRAGGVTAGGRRADGCLVL